MKKICFISSSGGHLDEIMMLKSLSNYYNTYLVTENVGNIDAESKSYYIPQINRKELSFIYKFIIVCFKSLFIYIKEKPDIIISTGALSVIPTFIIGKLFRKKLIFIESFANIETPTLTGKLLYQISDVFIIQWEGLKKYYPDAIFLGSIY